MDMEFARINSKKLKIQMTSEEWINGIPDYDPLDLDSTEAKMTFCNLLEQAKHETGFEATVDHTSVQVTRSEDGGYELWITKLDESTSSAILPISATIRFAPKLYLFEHLEDLLFSCRLLCERSFEGNSSAYFGEEGYYLSIGNPSVSLPIGASKLSGSDLLSEFGIGLSPTLLPYIVERSREICHQDAVSILGALAAR
jgi:hypothetical protein